MFINEIKKNDNSRELSFFYHLTVEIKSIDIWVSDSGRILHNYKEDSILKKIVNLVNDLGYKFSDIREI